MNIEVRDTPLSVVCFCGLRFYDIEPLQSHPCEAAAAPAPDRGLRLISSTDILDDVRPTLDRARLADALNAFELTASLSAFVETNLGTHRPDCGHVSVIAQIYDGTGVTNREEAEAIAREYKDSR